MATMMGYIISDYFGGGDLEEDLDVLTLFNELARVINVQLQTIHVNLVLLFICTIQTHSEKRVRSQIKRMQSIGMFQTHLVFPLRGPDIHHLRVQGVCLQR